MNFNHLYYNFLKHVCCISFFIFTLQYAVAQEDFRPGFLVNANKDTLKGEIDYRGNLLMNHFCTFRNADNAPEKKYTPKEILEYKFDAGKYYVSRIIQGEKKEDTVFLEVLYKGNLSVFVLTEKGDKKFFIERQEIGIKELPFKKGYTNRNGIDYLYESKRHKQLLAYYTMDEPAMEKFANDIDQPDESNLVAFAQRYQILKSGEVKQAYVSTVPLTKVDPEFAFGFVNGNDPDFYSRSYAGLGLLLHIYSPRLTEKLYLKTGIVYAKFAIANSNEVTSFKIPLHLEYIYPKGAVRPKLSYGLNIYNYALQTISTAGGINAKLNKAVFLSLIADAEFFTSNGIRFLPGKFASYSLMAGIQIKFNQK